MSPLPVNALRVPSFVRLLNRGGTDQIADVESFPSWWRFEDPLPAVMVAVADISSGAFYDVGANTGFYSIAVGKATPGVQIRAFEPVDEIAAACRENLELNRVPVAVYEVALSDSRGSATIYFPPAAHGLVETSATLDRGFNPSNERSAVVQTRTLDDVRDETGDVVGLIKVDVEGYEHVVLRGAQTTLEQDRPLVVVELLPGGDADELNRLVDQLDYRILSLRPGLVVDNQPTLAFIEDSWNQLLVPAERLAEVRDRIESTRADYEAAAGDEAAGEGWAEADTAVEFLLLQARVDRAVLQREAEINRGRREAGDGRQRSGAGVGTRIRSWWKG